MWNNLASIIFRMLLMTVLLGAPAMSLADARREVAITIDDLPVASSRRDIEIWRETTQKLLATIKRNKVPVVGFVNENKLNENQKVNPHRVELLGLWLDAGLELGNHTFSHRSLNAIPVTDFQADVLRGEAIIRPLIAARGKQLRYFRHPFLHTGRSIEVRDQFQAFLRSRAYTVAPVTIDNSDWVFARAYDIARDTKNEQAMKQIAEAYVPYMDAYFAHFEKQSLKLFGREIRQVLLIHANSINADCLDQLLAALRKRGYKFVTLERALQDPAYQSPDTFTGAGGISWLDRWALTRAVPEDFFKDEPRTPEFVSKLARIQG